MVAKTRKNQSLYTKKGTLRKYTPWSGWKNEKPGKHEKTVMEKECGQKCFLGKKQSFPICVKKTCRRSKKGVWAAYVRSRQYHKHKITVKAKDILDL